MKTYRFQSTAYVEAESEEHARDIFADESWMFAGNAEVEEIDPDTWDVVT